MSGAGARRKGPSRGGSPARRAALLALVRVDEARAFGPEALTAAFREHAIDGRDRAFATELAGGVLRWRKLLDHLIGAFSRRPVHRISPWTRNALRLGAYQVRFLASVPGPVACHETVELVKEREPWAAGFANGVCRALVERHGEVQLPDPADDPVRAVSVAASHPEWLVARWIARLGLDETITLCRTNNEPPAVTLRVNLARTSRDRVAAELARAGIEVVEGEYSPAALRIRGGGAVEELPGFREGHFQVQDESSQLVAWSLAPAGGRVADLCAAPGGKTTHLAELFASRSPEAPQTPRIVAFDRHPARLARVAENASRLGLSPWIDVRAGDAGELDPRETGLFERVLVDAPCSGTGVLRRRPDLRWRKEAGDLEALVAAQRRLLARAADLVAPGGALLYTTCSIEPEENEEAAAWFLSVRADFVASPFLHLLPEPAKGRLGKERFGLDGATLQLYPHRDGVDGFFLFRAEKLKI